MAQIRVTAATFLQLIELKKGLDTFDDVIARLLSQREFYLQLLKNQGKGKKGEVD